jgi:hypothetical protein
MNKALLLLLLLLPIIGCGDPVDPDPDNNGPSNSVIMPLKLGNTWIGRTTRTDANGTVVSVTYDTLKIVREVRIDSKIWYETNTDELLRNDQQGLHWKLESWDDCNCLRAKYPAMPADTFGTTSANVLVNNDVAEARLFTQVVSRDTVISVPLRTVASYHYRRRVESADPSKPIDAVMIQEHEFFAPNVGPVRRTGRDGSYWELVEVIIN